ncbi:MAG: ion transporter [Betaproteobacteria bacterium RIFCSPLOWO2_02_FULL_62_17]|nr:MAG: ion transporter [Betaproteobacteria bacterium RIFCSPLOWO2_02_FULL_62_17]
MPPAGWQRKAFTVIFESDTRAGRNFDVALLAAILVSVVVVMLDSVESITTRHGQLFHVLEWGFTLLFTAEYLARLACVQRPARYALSFFGLVDLLSVAPTYLAFFFPELHSLIDIRLLRMLRVFRILKVTAYMTEYGILGEALWASRRRIVVFIGTVFMIVVLMGTLIYVVEGPDNGFTSIPISVYWAITTMTTVGFGDITPKTDLGRAIASLMMLLGWGTLAVPTGIVTAEMTARRMGLGAESGPAPRACTQCGAAGHLAEARFCHACGAGISQGLPVEGESSPS